jgi:hypothetical protein
MLGSRYTMALAIVALSCASLTFGIGHKSPEKPKPSAKVAYATIAPILKGCVGCHMGAHPKHGLDLTSYANLIKGDKEGKVVVPGKPAASRLSKAVHRSGAAAMPPMGPLPAASVAKIDAWIKAGAKA